MSLSGEEIQRIERLRALFLDDARGAAAMPDYWRDEGDVAAYARTLGVRIGWKWDAALAECRDRGWPRTDDAVVLDFGCGAGIAAQRFVQTFGAKQVLCHDRSPVAMQFAARAVVAAAPGTTAAVWPDVRGAVPDVLLVSHVLGELDERGLVALGELLARARRVVLVEPGSKAVSRRLSTWRGALLTQFRVVAPCTHAAACPALVAADEWCHFFAAPPPMAFTDGTWVKAARQLGIDQRALPYAFLALERASEPTAAVLPPHRVVGRPTIDKHTVHARVCTAAGIVAAEVRRRCDPDAFRQWKRAPLAYRVVPAGPTPDAGPRAI